MQESRSLCLYISRRHFSRSQPFIRSFTLAWSKKCTVTTMIQMSLELWPKHCTSVGGPIKVLHSSLWELQPPVKDSSLEQHILKSGLALPRVDFLTFSLSRSSTAAPGEHVSSSQHKDAPRESQENPHPLLKHSIGTMRYLWVHLPGSLRVVGSLSAA